MSIGAMPHLPNAACRTREGRRLFLNVSNSTIGACKAVCAICPDQPDCLRWGLLHESQWGVWGGHTPGELDYLRRLHGIEVEVLRADIRIERKTPGPRRRTFTAANAARLGTAPEPQPAPAPEPAPIDDGPDADLWDDLVHSPTVRKWARADGWSVPRGRRLPGAIVIAYLNAHSGVTA